MSKEYIEPWPFVFVTKDTDTFGILDLIERGCLRGRHIKPFEVTHINGKILGKFKTRTQALKFIMVTSKLSHDIF